MFASGGYTGQGMYKDKTGERVAGIVHQGEWVAPKWMVNSYGDLFQQLESVRLGKTNRITKSILPTSPINNINNDTILHSIVRESNTILQTQLATQKRMLRLLQKFDDGGIKCIS